MLCYAHFINHAPGPDLGLGLSSNLSQQFKNYFKASITYIKGFKIVCHLGIRPNGNPLPKKPPL